MEELIQQGYSDSGDLDSMLEFLLAVRPIDRLRDYPTLQDVREALALGEVQAKTRLWRDRRGRLAAWAYVDGYSNLHFEINTAFEQPKLEAQIVDWGVACIHSQMLASGEMLTLDASCPEEDSWRRAFYERHGFVRQEVRSLHYVRSLAEPIPVPQLPPGFSVRHVSSEREAPALVALHRAAFGTQHMTVAERLAMMQGPEYDPPLDLVAVAPDGSLAAYCFCSYSPQESALSGRNEGYTDPLATHPKYQRKGLGRALLVVGMQKLKQRGAEWAALGTSSENLAMQRTAQAVGFRLQSSTVWFSKPVDAPTLPATSASIYR
jgi:ribosomal protein S18 acetylase RimI-like enzyme